MSRLHKKIRLSGIIIAETGLHIGGSGTNLGIGGADATVIRNVLTNEPYIPGSSLKGKMRSLLERLEVPVDKLRDSAFGNIDFGPYLDINDPTILIPFLFGTLPDRMEKSNPQPPGRLTVRDCHLTPESSSKLFNSPNSAMPFTEVKTEVVIDRVTAMAVPRQIERVPAGAEFSMEMIINLFEDDDEKAYIEKALEGLLLVQSDYLGGKGTRGSGKVRFEITSIEERSQEDYEQLKGWQPCTHVTPPSELQRSGADHA